MSSVSSSLSSSSSSADFAVVKDFGRARCLFEHCWFGCRCRGGVGERGGRWERGRIGCLSLLLTKSLAMESNSELSCVVSQIVVVSGDSGWL